MNIQFDDNEFTSIELMKYLKAAYGVQINGVSFSTYNLNNWIRMGKLPEAYGGHKIEKVAYVKSFASKRVLTLDGLTRDILNDIYLLENKIPTKRTAKTKLPRKHRTGLYFQILEKAGKQYTIRTKEQSTIPEDWKLAGIKSNQLARIGKRKLKTGS
jgi:hypothetical protein